MNRSYSGSQNSAKLIEGLSALENCPSSLSQFPAPSSLSSLLPPVPCPVCCPQFLPPSSLPPVPCPAPSSLPKFLPVPCPQFPVQFAAPSSLSQVPCPQFAAPSSLPPTSLSPVPCPKFPVPFLPPPRLEALHTAIGDQPRLRSTCRP